MLCIHILRPLVFLISQRNYHCYDDIMHSFLCQLQIYGTKPVYPISA